MYVWGGVYGWNGEECMDGMGKSVWMGWGGVYGWDGKECMEGMVRSVWREWGSRLQMMWYTIGNSSCIRLELILESAMLLVT